MSKKAKDFIEHNLPLAREIAEEILILDAIEVVTSWLEAGNLKEKYSEEDIRTIATYYLEIMDEAIEQGFYLQAAREEFDEERKDS